MRIVLFIIAMTLTACNISSDNKNRATESKQQRPKNIILLIGDGMGPASIKAYRMFKDDPNTKQEEKLVFDRYLVGGLSTDPDDEKVNITDSAASATAYATGEKTYSGAISVNPQEEILPTILERAKILGLSTGLVATSEIVHATPAAFASHQKSRKNKVDIANQYFDKQINGMPMVDVLLGGGVSYFVREDRNLVTEFQQKGYQLLSNDAELSQTNGDKLLGLFAPQALAKMWDRNATVPSLKKMTDKAIEQLSKNEKGFFLMVEGSQIDWAGHANDIVSLLSEMEDFEAAVKSAIDFAKKDGNTLVIVTADHSTGGLSIGSKTSGSGFYYWDVNLLKTFKYTPLKMIEDAKASGDLVAEFYKASSMQLTKEEEDIIRNLDINSGNKVYLSLNKIISDKSFTGWTTDGHTGVDVNLYAFGPSSKLLIGHWDNTKIGQFIFEQWQDK